MPVERGRARGPSREEIAEKQDALVRDISMQVRNGYGFATETNPDIADFTTEGELVNYINGLPADAAGVQKAGQAHGEALAHHYFNDSFDPNKIEYRTALQGVVLGYAATVGGFDPGELDFIITTPDNEDKGKIDERKYIALAATLAFFERNGLSARRNTLSELTKDMELTETGKGESGDRAAWDRTLYYMGHLAGFGSGILIYKATGNPGIAFGLGEGLVLGGTGGGAYGAWKGIRQENATAATSKRAAADQKAAGENARLNELKRLATEEDPNFHKLVKQYDERLRSLIPEKGNVREAVLEILRPEKLNVFKPEAKKPDNRSSRERFVEDFRKAGKLVGKYARKGAVVVAAGVFAASIAHGLSGEGQTGDTKGHTTEVTKPKPAPETDPDQACSAVGLKTAPEDFPLDQAVIIPQPDDPSKRVVCVPPGK